MPHRGPPPELHDLTERELDVMRLVARGLTNAEMATKLHLGEATVKSHVAHILAKLRLRDRTQTVVIAHETGLLEPGKTERPPPPGGLSDQGFILSGESVPSR
jgi:DNA-binding NarL/FixJ family response regulator